MDDIQYDNDTSCKINENHNIEPVKEIDDKEHIKYNDINNIKINSQNHTNDMIFRDSVQSAISTPSPPDAISTTTSPVKNACVTLDHLDTPDFIENNNKDDFSDRSMTIQESDLTEPSLSIKDSSQDHTDILEQLEKIPDRMGFKISEVAFLTGVKSYVLRYWESEFEALRPKKATNNRRIYTQKDITTVLLIKKLLYKDKYAIEGAKKVLRTLQTEIKQQRKVFILFHQQQEAIKQLKELINTIFSLKKLYN